MRYIKPALVFFIMLTCLKVSAYSKDETAIRKVLEQQSAAWNRGDIDAYMTGYWNNDSLVFIGKNGPTYGYNATLQRYKSSYPDAEKMGKLNFTILQVKELSKEYYFVLGKWELKRSVGDLSGHFTLLFRHIGGRWLIVADHSS